MSCSDSSRQCSLCGPPSRFSAYCRRRIGETAITLALAVLVFAFAAVKNIHDDYSAWGSYVGVVIAGVVVAVAWQAYQRSSVASVEAPVVAPVD